MPSRARAADRRASPARPRPRRASRSPSTVRVPASAPASASATRTRPERRRNRSRSDGSATTQRPRTRTNGRFASASASSSSSVSTSPSTHGLPAEVAAARRGRDRRPPRSPAPGSDTTARSSSVERVSSAGHSTSKPAAANASAAGPSRSRGLVLVEVDHGRTRVVERAGERGPRPTAPAQREEQVGLGLVAEPGQHDGGRVPQLVGVDDERRVDAAAELYDGARRRRLGRQLESEAGPRAVAVASVEAVEPRAACPTRRSAAPADHAGDDAIERRGRRAHQHVGDRVPDSRG